MRWSRLTYEMVAKTLRETLSLAQRRLPAVRFATEFKLDNPRFDEKRFFEACGLFRKEVG